MKPAVLYGGKINMPTIHGGHPMPAGFISYQTKNGIRYVPGSALPDTRTARSSMRKPPLDESSMKGEASSKTGNAAFSPFLWKAVLSGPGIHGILIDSEGLPNSMDMEVTQLSNHDGDINVETRLIYICERSTGLPLYFRYISGNIVDFSTLATTVEELEKAGVCTDFAILDAGYYCEGNIKLLYEKGIAFVTRLKQNRVLYKELVAEHLSGLQSPEHLVAFNKRFLFIQKTPCKLQGRDAFAYICKDPVMGMLETRARVPAALADGASRQEVFETIQKAGVFVIISSEDMKADEILPLYYTRQQIEQVFDITKNYAEVLPLRVHSEETFRGHLFVSFVAAIACHLMQKLFKDKGTNQMEALRELRNQKCKLYDKVVIPMEPRKKMNDIYKISKIQCPVRIPVDN